MVSRKRKSAATRDQKHYPAMLRIAREMGCALRPNQANPLKMRGVCPFHQATSLNNAQTLSIDAKELRFACNYCHASGSPVAFAAMAWNTSARDARELLEDHPEAGATRPPYQRAAAERHRANTAVLTRAMDHYRQQLSSGNALVMPTLLILAQLGLSVEQAADAGLGVSTGAGLAQHLKDTGASESEITESPLFLRQDREREFLAGRTVIADLDYTGAALWINSLNPDQNRDQSRINPNKPGTTGIMGSHPYLMGMERAAGEKGKVIVTDDARLHLVARAQNQASLFWSAKLRGDNREAKQIAAERITERVKQTPAKTVILMMHDSTVRSMCAWDLRKTGKQEKTLSLGRAEILRQLNPLTRDLPGLERRSELSGTEPEPPFRWPEGEG